AAGDVEAQGITGPAHLGRGRLQSILNDLLGLVHGMLPSSGAPRQQFHSRRMSNPTSTRSVWERSPMIFLIGLGSRRTRVGMARIWSPWASCGVTSRSITSIV